MQIFIFAASQDCKSFDITTFLSWQIIETSKNSPQTVRIALEQDTSDELQVIFDSNLDMENDHVILFDSAVVVTYGPQRVWSRSIKSL